jgi:DNA topoisomerase-1
MKNLVIVESPAKAKTIEKFLGADYTVVSCKGHIRDLADGNDAIDIDNGFMPKYVVSDDRQAVVRELKSLVKKAEVIWLATDEDREGEAISWHLAEELKLDKTTTKRIVFNEITKPAIQKAIQNPRSIDQFLVDAQQARRILDRLVGYTLSPVLWKQVRPRLSAGRVQSVAVRLVVEREREIIDFVEKSEFKVVAMFEKANGKVIRAELPQKFANKELAETFLAQLIGAKFHVGSIEVKPTYRSPSAPFTTSTLQQEASRKLGFDVSRTMRVAQKLYENGHITYMRTDSTNLSKTAIDGAKNEILSAYGEAFSEPKNFATKSDSAQEAHEAIRPTYFEKHKAGSTPEEQRLYDLIWKRSIASQMSKARLEKTTLDILNSNTKDVFKASGEVIKFEGFLKVYLEGTDDESDEDQEGMLPAVTEGESLAYQNITAQQKFAKHAPRYTEASLVKKLEELGIGRPSTYAPTIQTIQKRGYILQESRPAQQREIPVITLKADAIVSSTEMENFGAEKNKLFPSDIGMLVTDFLSEHFKDIMDYGFTAQVEAKFDEIAKGMQGWQLMLSEFYKPFKISVADTIQNGGRVSGERILGKDPISGLTILVRMGQYGPMVQLGSREETENPSYASLLKTQRLETVTLQDAIQLLSIMNNGFEFNDQKVQIGVGRFGAYIKYGEKYINVKDDSELLSLTQAKINQMLTEFDKSPSYPVNLGNYEDKPVQVNAGRFGPYVKHASLFASIPKAEDPFLVTLERAIELIEKKREDDKQKMLKTFEGRDDVSIQKGRYGAFIKFGKENLKIPKDTDYNDLTLADIEKIAKESIATDKKSGAKKSTTTKRAAAKKPAAKKATVKKASSKK